MSDPTDDATPRYVITGGGTPPPEALAAMAVALTPVAVVDDAGDQDTSAVTSGWAHAALMEGVGHRVFVAAPDLAKGRFPLG